MKGGKPMNVSYSTTPKGEKLIDMKLNLQWNDIDWRKVEENVNRMQTRITKAVIQGKWNLVKRLQYLLTHSFYAKLLAVRAICQNKGKRTAGIDGKKWLTPQAKMNAALGLSDKNYKATPSRRVYIDKPGKKEKRPLSIPTMYDRAMQALYAFALKSNSRSNSRYNLFWLQKKQKCTGCVSTSIYLSEQEKLCSMDTGRRYQKLF
jgi:RNA-directed DNA polymerase